MDLETVIIFLTGSDQLCRLCFVMVKRPLFIFFYNRIFCNLNVRFSYFSRLGAQGFFTLYLGLSLWISLIMLPSQAQAQAQAQSQFQSQSQSQSLVAVKIEGLKKVDIKALLSKVQSTHTEPLDPQKVRKDILVIYKMGYFSKVQAFLNSEGVLVFRVEEKPSLVEVKFEGFQDSKDEELKEAANVKAFEILDPARIQTATEKLQKFYEGKGYFLAKVTSRLETVLEGESVRVVFSVNQSEKIKVQKITFLGNSQLTTDFLKSRMVTSEGTFFSFMSGAGGFKQEAFERDLQVLRLTYMNEGFVQAKIDKPQIFVTPDRKHIYMTFKVEEGERYSVGEIDFAGDLLFPREELLELVQIKEQKNFSYEAMQKDLMSLQAKYGDLGYAYANVLPRTRINEKEKVIDLVFEFDKGSKVYFGQITITGNSKTRDKVVRRELRILEGELYNETRRRRSLENVQRLGFFDDVSFKTSVNSQDPNRMDVEVVIKERHTGSIQLGMGFGTVTGFTAQGSVNQINFLGKGQRLSASLNSSRIGSFYNLNFTEPQFNDTNYLLGFDLYQSGVDRFEYEERRVGGSIRVGNQINDHLLTSLRYKLDKTDLRAYTGANGISLTDLTLFPLETASGVTSSVTGTIEYDERDDRFVPSKGQYASASVEYAGLGGDLRFTKTNATYRYFKKVFWEVVWRNNLTHSFLTSHDSNVQPPFNERFLLGGPYSLRGYRFFRVGRTQFSQQTYEKYKNPPFNFDEDRAQQMGWTPFGGTQQLMYQTELEFPMIKEAGIRGVVFFDIGQAEDVIREDGFYSNVGFGLRWFSPMGPLRFEWAFPLKHNPASPDKVIFDFSIGSPF
jgi:outer membrane protein insertion porin family